MSRSRAFNRFHRWTAKVRRRHLKAWLPEGHEAEASLSPAGGDRRQNAVLRDAMRDLNDPLPLDDDLAAEAQA